MENKSETITSVKTDAAGCLYWGYADEVTELPIAASAKIDSKVFRGPLIISSDGVSNTPQVESTDVTDMGGNLVTTLIQSYSEEYGFTLLEFLAKSAAELFYGSENVSGSDGEFTAYHKAPNGRPIVLVFDTIHTGDIKCRNTIPLATLSNRGEQGWKTGDPMGYPVTMKAAASTQIGGATAVTTFAKAVTAAVSE